VTQVVARITTAMARAGGSTSQGQTGRAKSSGSLKAQLSIDPQLTVPLCASPRNASVASAKMANRTVRITFVGRMSRVAGRRCSRAR